MFVYPGKGKVRVYHRHVIAKRRSGGPMHTGNEWTTGYSLRSEAENLLRRETVDLVGHSHYAVQTPKAF